MSANPVYFSGQTGYQALTEVLARCPSIHDEEVYRTEELRQNADISMFFYAQYKVFNLSTFFVDQALESFVAQLCADEAVIRTMMNIAGRIGSICILQGVEPSALSAMVVDAVSVVHVSENDLLPKGHRDTFAIEREVLQDRLAKTFWVTAFVCIMFTYVGTKYFDRYLPK